MWPIFHASLTFWNVTFTNVFPNVFSSPGQRPCELLPSLGIRRPYIVNFNLLIRNHWANGNQTLVEWSLGGPPWKLCPVIPTSNQDGHQAKNRIKGDDFFLNLLLGWSPSKIVSDISDLRPRWPPQPNLIYHRTTVWEIHIKIFSSETTGPIATKLWWNGLCIAPSKIVSGDPDSQPRWPPS